MTDISFSSNGKYMASISADDRNVILWSTKELGADATRNMVRGKVDLDNPVSVDFSPDCKALALGLELTNSVKIMKIAKKEGTSTVTLTEGMEFPQVLDLDILTCAISPSGTYIMIADNKNSVYILDLKGIVLGKIDAKVGGDIHHCVVSPCGRFVAFCGYNPEMPIYEVEFSSTNVFRGELLYQFLFHSFSYKSKLSTLRNIDCLKVVGSLVKNKVRNTNKLRSR